MAKTIVGLYDEVSAAQDAVRELVDSGFSREDISMVTRDGDVEGREGKDRGSQVGESAGRGAIIGGVGGLLVGLGALAIPGIGPAVAAGPIAAALTGAGIGAVGGGLIGALVGAGVPEDEAEYYAEGVRRGGTLVTVDTSDDMASKAVDILNRHHPVDIEERAERWRTAGWSRFDEKAQPYGRQEIDRERTQYRTEGRREGEATIPIAEEHLRVGKRQTARGGARIHTRVSEHEEQETVRLRRERVDVEERKVDRPTTASDQDLFQERTIEVPTVSEEPVVGKETRITGEVRVKKEVEERPETVTGTVRRTEVDVEKMGGTEGYATYEPHFRQHFQSNLAGRNRSYEEFRPAYHYGMDLRSSARGRDWRQVEPEARREWERSHREHGTWDEVKDAVREGWNRVTGR